MTAMAAYEAGLAGADCWFSTEDGIRHRLPLARWSGSADHRDEDLVAAVLADLTPGARVLDAGCGPGRLTAALNLAGRPLGVIVLGLDISTVAVGLTRARGAVAMRGDIHAPPRSVRARPWDRVLLADGNLGIGGDPVRLLRRASGLLGPHGRVVADVLADGDVVRGPAWIQAEHGGTAVGGEVPWAWVGAGAVERLGQEAGLRLRHLSEPRSSEHPRARHRIAVWETAVREVGR